MKNPRPNQTKPPTQRPNAQTKTKHKNSTCKSECKRWKKKKKEIAYSGSRVSKLDVLQSFRSSIGKVLNICKCIFCPKIVSHWVTSPNKPCNISGGGCVVSEGVLADGRGARITARVFEWGPRFSRMLSSLSLPFCAHDSSQRWPEWTFSPHLADEKDRGPERSRALLEVA